ncbi:MAG: arginine--tRNA ligase [Candidatus Paceibacterota bacterium]|jgi:arginyl-tRNA synthetase
MNLKDRLFNILANSVGFLQAQGIVPAGFDPAKIKIDHPDHGRGDYATGLALQMGKLIGKNPMEAAEILKQEIEKQKMPEIERIEIAAPGFLNFFASERFLSGELEKILKEKKNYGRGKKNGKTVLIDYSAVNIAKPFGIGHLRSTIIGQAVYNLYEFLGWKAIGDNHLGDWGTQYGKLSYQLFEKKLKGLSSKEAAKILSGLTIAELEKIYVEFHQEAESKPEMEDSARQWFRKLEQGDKTAKMIWDACVKISLKEFERIYDLLGVKIDYAIGESFYLDKAAAAIKEAKEKGLAKESQGALIFEYPNEALPPAMLLKSDESSIYFTRDLAAIKYRIKRWHPNLFIYEVGTEQSLHMKQLFLAAELLGWLRKDQLVHIGHGLYRSPEGKFSTRKGNTIHLEEVLGEAISRAGKLVEGSASAKDLKAKEKEEIAKEIGVGAIKYNDLSQHYSKEIVFDWDKMLNLRGNSGPYLQYVVVRCQSILNKAGASSKTSGFGDLVLAAEERAVLSLLSKFPEMVAEAARTFSPNLLCNYAFELAQSYNLFYEKLPILKAEKEEQKIFRLALTKAAAQVLTNSLNLLGIEVPERM